MPQGSDEINEYYLHSLFREDRDSHCCIADGVVEVEDHQVFEILALFFFSEDYRGILEGSLLSSSIPWVMWRVLSVAWYMTFGTRLESMKAARLDPSEMSEIVLTSSSFMSERESCWILPATLQIHTYTGQLANSNMCIVPFKTYRLPSVVDPTLLTITGRDGTYALVVRGVGVKTPKYGTQQGDRVVPFSVHGDCDAEDAKLSGLGIK